MIISLMYVIFAILGLSFLIFIHELGHYFMARRVGMRVETFAIGFGKPIYSWERNGVKWQIGWLLFGGYVKIAGAELSGEQSPYEIPDGFFGKKPLDRIKVSFMGPFVNLVFAFIFFTILWLSGGREKNFSEFTSIIGWVDPHSELYADGVRPGDEITAYDSHPFQSAKDHIYSPMTGSSEINVKGFKVNYATKEKTPFDYKVKVYPRPELITEKGVLTAGIMQPANYILYDRLPNKDVNPLPEGSPLTDSGIKYGDRIVWVNGELVFSSEQLNHILNENNALLTIKRGKETLLRRIPRVLVKELKADTEFKEELVDWQFEARLNNVKIQNLYTIPYNLKNDCTVENDLKFIDKDNEDKAFPLHRFSPIEEPLQPGDKIIAVNGIAVQHAAELLKQLQEYHANIIVERDIDFSIKVPVQEADADFENKIEWNDLQKIVQTIGTDKKVTEAGNFYLLKSVTPKVRSEFALPPEKQALFNAEIVEQKKQIEAIEDPEKRNQALHLLEQLDKRLLLGLPNIQGRKVEYNPGPAQMFVIVFQEIWRTLSALFSGSLNPKWISGPIGIVQVVHDTSMTSIREAIYWLGAISLNLGMLNLLPIPVLDGGTIVLSLFEMVTKKRINPKTLEKLTIPFAILLIGFFVFLTYNDLSRLLSKFIG